jgi:hypothetical protein
LEAEDLEGAGHGRAGYHPRGWSHVGIARVAFSLQSGVFAPSRSALALLVASLGCAPIIGELPEHEPRRALEIDEIELDECRRVGDELDYEAFTPAQGPLPEFPLPNEIRRVATIAGVLPMLAALHEPGNDDLAVRLQLVMRLSALEIQVSSLAYEAQCVGAQIDAMLVELAERQDRYEVAMTVTSISLGALVAAGGGVWDLNVDSDDPAILIIAGGVASAGLGLAAFIPERRPVVFEHQRNLLAAIASGEDPERVLPPFVFLFATTPDEQGRTLRDEILADWREVIADNYPAEQRALVETILYGEGGLYDAKLLDVREQLLDILETHVDGINQELELLYRYSARLVEVPLATP